MILFSVGMLWCCGLSQLCHQDHHQVYLFFSVMTRWLMIQSIRDKKCWSCGSEALSKGSLVSHCIWKAFLLPTYLTPKSCRSAKWREFAARCREVPERGVEGGGWREADWETWAQKWGAGVHQKCGGWDQGESCEEGGFEEGVTGLWGERICCQKGQPDTDRGSELHICSF